MAEALLSLTQELLSWWECFPDGDEDLLEEQSDEAKLKEEIGGMISVLRMILDFSREKKLEEGSRLHYFISDAIEMARDALDTTKFEEHPLFLGIFVGTINYYLTNTKNCMLQFKEQSPIRLENLDKGDDDGDVVGLEEDVELLLRREILVDAQSFRILLITGISGVGKTTLARELYNRADVVGRFERRAWVRVSTDLSHKEVLMKLIQQVVDSELIERDSLLEKMERADNKGLQRMLFHHLQGMNYLIVLDDVPRQMNLHSIMKALPRRDKKQYRLVLTSCTRITTLLDEHYFAGFHYEMKSLDSNKSWQLFLKTMFCGNKFTREETFPKHLEEKGKEMLMKICDGLPIAIKEVARKLAEKRLTGTEWEDLFDSIDLDYTLELLESTYRRWSPETKSCFLYLAFFKDNTAICLRKLTNILVATEMAPHEQTVYDHYVELHRESVIEAKNQLFLVKRKICRMNVALHMLSVRKAEEEIGFEVITSNDGMIRPTQSPRHRVIYCSREKFNYSTDQDKHLVSLLFRGGGCFDSSPSYWKSLEQLKVLDFEDFGLKVLPESISNMPELRYLGLRNNYIQELPNSLGRLKKLKVLDIALNLMVEVPDIIWELGSLRHLYMSDVICRMPLKIDALQNLMSLNYISVDNWTYEISGLQMMTSLHGLGIDNLHGNTDVSKLFLSLADLQNLRCLILRGSRFRRMPCLDELGCLHSLFSLELHGLLAKLPSAENFPPKLSDLKLVDSCLDEDPMPVLNKLPELGYLTLRNAYTGQQMVILDNGFPRLDRLGLKKMRNLRNVRVGKDVFQRLRWLEINSCPRLETLPKDIWPRNTNRTELKMVTTQRIATKLRKSGSIPQLKHVDISP